jgi:hypothetical protein
VLGQTCRPGGSPALIQCPHIQNRPTTHRHFIHNVPPSTNACGPNRRGKSPIVDAIPEARSINHTKSKPFPFRSPGGRTSWSKLAQHRSVIQMHSHWTVPGRWKNLVRDRTRARGPLWNLGRMSRSGSSPLAIGLGCTVFTTCAVCSAPNERFYGRDMRIMPKRRDEYDVL